jgi:transcriptional regulator with XRE-family HTH domain
LASYNSLAIRKNTWIKAMPRTGQSKADEVVGRNIRIFRQKMRISQSVLTRQVGVTFQQIQKYEKGVNRVGASRLAQIAAALNIPIPSLFEGVERGHVNHVSSPQELLADANAVRLAEAFAEIRDPRIRRTIVELITQMADKMKVVTKARSDNK